MIRKLMASSALIALMSAGAIGVAQAQSDPATPVIVQDNTAAVPDNTAAPTTELAASSQAITPEQPTLASTIIGRSVYSSSDPKSDNIGDVNDLIVAEDGSVTHAVVGVGGFLGIGEKNVAVRFDELKVVENNGDLRLVYSATKEQLEAAPAFDRTAYDPAARAVPETSTAATDATGMTPPVAPEPATDIAVAPAPALDEQTAATDAADVTQPVEPAPTGDMAAAPAPAPVDEQTAASDAADVTQPVEPAATGDIAAAPAPADEQTAASGSTAATSDQMAASDTSGTASDNVPPAGYMAFINASPDQVRANWLIGKSVYGPDNQSIGEVHDLVLQKDTGVRVALIDVGGFLGIGAKTVAIPFTDLKFAKVDNSTEPQVTVAMSKDQLNNQPAYDTTALDDSTAANVPPAPATTDNTMATNETATDPTAPAGTDQVATTDMMATDPTANLTTGSISPSQDIAASKLIGATVYASDDSSIGEVGDIVFNDKGDIDAIVVDVGGFLGIGEKPVALSFEQLNMRTDENGYLTLVVTASKEQLNNAPAYETIMQ